MNGAVILAGREIWLRKSAKRLGIGPSYLSKVLSGKRDPLTLRVGFMLEMAKLFEFDSIEALLTAMDERRKTLETGPVSPVTDTPGGDVMSTSHHSPSVIS